MHMWFAMTDLPKHTAQYATKCEYEPCWTWLEVWPNIMHTDIMDPDAEGHTPSEPLNIVYTSGIVMSLRFPNFGTISLPFPLPVTASMTDKKILPD